MSTQKKRISGGRSQIEGSDPHFQGKERLATTEQQPIAATTKTIPTDNTTHTHTHNAQPTDTLASKEERLVLADEKLKVGKNQQEAGALDVSKHVERTAAQVPVQLEHEVVSVERRPLHGHETTTEHLTEFGKPKEVVATVHAEQAVAGKTVVPTEQVVVEKKRVAEEGLVQDKVRTENAEVKPQIRDVDAVRWTGGDSSVQRGPIMDSSGRVVAHEEKLAVGKERVHAGQVEVGKRVDTVSASAPVRLEHDEVAVHRGPPTQPISATHTPFTEGRERIPLTRETPAVAKEVVPKEEVVVRKGVEKNTAMVSGELLKERITTQAEGGAHATHSAPFSSASSSSAPFSSSSSSSAPFSSTSSSSFPASAMTSTACTHGCSTCKNSSTCSTCSTCKASTACTHGCSTCKNSSNCSSCSTCNKATSGACTHGCTTCKNSSTCSTCSTCKAPGAARLERDL